jgi:predicted lipoprotein with Yx(FWY)xxD motif
MQRRTSGVFLVAMLVLGLATTASAPGGQTVSSRQTVITVAFNKALGKRIVVDGNGRSVYMFVLDTRGKATCIPQWEEHPACHRVLPPVRGGARAGAGIDASKLGTTKRSDGTQITYNGYPLYYFKGGSGYGRGDDRAGDLNGQGFYRMFFVLSPKGRPVRALP